MKKPMETTLLRDAFSTESYNPRTRSRSKNCSSIGGEKDGEGGACVFIAALVFVIIACVSLKFAFVDKIAALVGEGEAAVVVGATLVFFMVNSDIEL